MRIAVIANQVLKQELSSREPAESIEWHTEIEGIEDVDVVIDLSFSRSADRIAQLNRSGAELILVNDVNGSLSDLPFSFVRINGWPGFLSGDTIEYSAREGQDEKLQELLSIFKKTGLAVPDQPGFISCRIVAMIINEAYLALEENVSSREDIDTAMKLGTNYPFGPFEWAQKIGVKHIHELLLSLAEKDKLYQPAPLLVNEALS